MKNSKPFHPKNKPFRIGLEKRKFFITPLRQMYIGGQKSGWLSSLIALTCNAIVNSVVPDRVKIVCI